MLWGSQRIPSINDEQQETVISSGNQTYNEGVMNHENVEDVSGFREESVVPSRKLSRGIQHYSLDTENHTGLVTAIPCHSRGPVSLATSTNDGVPENMIWFSGFPYFPRESLSLSSSYQHQRYHNHTKISSPSLFLVPQRHQNCSWQISRQGLLDSAPHASRV